MRPWKHLFPDVMPAVPAVSEPMAEHHIRRATQDFCRRTRAWREKLDPVLTVEGARVYDLDMPPFAELVRLESATLAGEVLEVWRAGFGARCGRYIATPDGKTVELQFAHGAGLALVVDASLMPANNAAGFESPIFDRYDEVIATGAIARLTGDEMKAAQFESRCNAIKTDLWRGMAATRPRARPFFF